MIPPNQTLVKYDNPVLMSKTTDKKSSRARAKRSGASPGMPGSASATMTSGAPVPTPPRGGKLPPVEKRAAQQTEDILNSILPPREYTDSGQLWIQQVSASPATRLDVIGLQEQLDTKLQQRQARETGICPVRRELYSQVFDELIRQVTVECAERGLLLLRVRDEIRMTLAAYQTLYESSTAFGMRKALDAEAGKGDMEQQILQLKQENADLSSEVLKLKAKCEEIELREKERRATEQRKHEEELQFLKRTNQQLKTQLESILAPPKK
jgi:dynein light intermediate chain